MSEPSEMVQRVADSLRAECRKQFGTDWSYDYAWAFARAAIEAMRGPTEEMWKAARQADNFPQEPDPGEAIWHAMIDAALTTPHKGG